MWIPTPFNDVDRLPDRSVHAVPPPVETPRQCLLSVSVRKEGNDTTGGETETRASWGARGRGFGAEQAVGCGQGLEERWARREGSRGGGDRDSPCSPGWPGGGCVVPPGGPARAPQGGPEVAAWSRRGESSPCSPGWPRGPRTHHLVATSPQLVVIHPARLGVRLPSGRVPSALCSFGLPPGRRRRRRRAPSAASSSAAAVARRGRFTSCRSLGYRRDLRVARRSAPQLRGAARATEHARAGRACSVAPPPSFHPRPGCEGGPRWEEMEKVRQVPGRPLGRQPVGSGRWQKEEKKKRKKKETVVPLDWRFR